MFYFAQKKVVSCQADILFKTETNDMKFSYNIDTYVMFQTNYNK